MLLNMSLHLSDVNTEPAIQTQTYHALAEAYFNINELERALTAGKNCFKLQSVKSKVQFEPFYYARASREVKKQHNGSNKLLKIIIFSGFVLYGVFYSLCSCRDLICSGFTSSCILVSKIVFLFL